LEDNNYDIIGGEDYSEGGGVNGRVTSAPESDMMDIGLYTDDSFGSYDNLKSTWDITTVSTTSDRDTNYIWNIDNTNSYPFFSYEK
ncbi:MAG: hypothetical protein ACOCP8_03795, partial [archaeon]